MIVSVAAFAPSLVTSFGFFVSSAHVNEVFVLPF